MDDPESFGEYLLRVIFERGLNQHRAALAMGVNPGMVSHWVRGDRKPKPINVQRLAALLDLDETDLMQRAGYLPRHAAALDPKRAELIRAAAQVPLDQADTAIAFLASLRPPRSSSSS